MRKIINIAEDIGTILFNSSNKNLYNHYQLVHSRLKKPQSFITLVGETSSGKSTLINGFLKKPILPYGSRPITGTVTQINCNETKETLFFAIERDSSISEINQDTFIDLSKTPDNELLRLYVETNAPENEFIGLNIFDTPGFNSINLEHEEVLKKFIPESDVILFIVSYRVGFNIKEHKFMKIIEEILKEDKNLPVLLVVNRCPENIAKDDKRIKEIYSYASDTLHKELELYLIPSFIREDGNDVLPFSNELWSRVSYYSNSNERKDMIHKKSRLLLSDLSDQMIAECEGILIALEIDPEHISFLEKEIYNLNNNLQLSYIIVNKYIKKLENSLPKLINKEIDNLIKIIKDEIYSSNKWTDNQSCILFLQSHTLPFNSEKILHNIENYIFETFEQMDNELNEMANKTIFNLEYSIKDIKNPNLSNLLKNISKKIAYKVAKSRIKDLITDFGGRGGYASGLGNLVKMTVSKTGKLFGHTFSREIYNQIGKQFTKEFVKKLNTAFLILIEFVGIIREAKTWQNKLFNECQKSLDNFNKEVISELIEKNLPEYEKSNKILIEDIYESMKEEIQNSINNIKNKLDSNKQNKLINYIELLNKHKKEMEILNG